ncbi:MAG TPA: RNA polymerase-associated protein RapA, partial [Gammaproteobacteria bacterium]|nr:RNA polymerase-associated protein RapA [Gammaproteobacteria bacterium]
MKNYIPGQRWISDAELEMGLGTVLAVDQRTVSVLFLATGETRVYSRQTAPLTRIAFAVGDRVKMHDGDSINIESVEENDGILSYLGTDSDGNSVAIDEGKLDNLIQLNRPADRLFTGQIDKDNWFELRYQTLLERNRYESSDLNGITGGRTFLLPHQLYIAHEVANRYAPRVLLADEVGLGKTIEAGLILHHQLITERAKRILIVVPESLLHQWLVEMLRRFNLYFSVFDEERCLATDVDVETDEPEEKKADSNPFHTEQLVICTLEFLVESEHRFEQALAGEWDMLIVDEAHHLQWSEHESSIEYQRIEQLAVNVKGVLLLTATPEQLGKQGHFARLRLLDQDRFPDYSRFINEENSYEPVASAIEELLNQQEISELSHQTLDELLKEDDNKPLLDQIKNNTSNDPDKQNQARADLTDHLLDRHGTGRILFRNTRSAIKGFPDRKLTDYPLAMPAEYIACREAIEPDRLTPNMLLFPELLYQLNDEFQGTHWTTIDPRVSWLAKLLNQLKSQKVLVITASAETAMDLSDTLRIKSGIHAAVFHENMTLVERDRAAAFFADMTYGSQILICSEIGSEGRNFQFAHHLALFDLPLNPDLLEQRIGRLDRIGQSETIKLHVPYLKDSAQDMLFHWYRDGLSAFEHTCPAGHSVFAQVKSELVDVITCPYDEHLVSLINRTTEIHKELNDVLSRGQDKLLEYNSCRPDQAEKLAGRATQLDISSTLPQYLEKVFDCFDIEKEPHSEGCYVIKPSEQMQTGDFPGLSSDGMTYTCERSIALANDDVQFLTWEHPLVTGIMDTFSSNELGNTAMSSIKYNGVKSGSLLIECIYILESASNDQIQSSRYLPPTSIRIVIDTSNQDHASQLSHDDISQSREIIKKETAYKIIHAYTKSLREMLDNANSMANRQSPAIRDHALKHAEHTLASEINRLRALKQINPNVRSEEIL